MLVIGRASEHSGARGRTRAVRNTLEALGLLRAHGILVDDPPEEDTLIRAAAVHARRVQSVTQDGKPLLHRVLEYPVPAAPQVVLLVQQGTGTAIADDLRQAAATTVTETVRRLRPALVAAAEIRAIVRDGAALGQCLLAMRFSRGTDGSPLYFLDRDRGLSRWGPDVESRLTQDAENAAEEARRTEQRTRPGMQRNTGHAVVKGQFDYGYGGALPPPLALVRMKDHGGTGMGRTVAYLDTPQCRPPADQVLFRRPTLTRVESETEVYPDQVEILREFYRIWLTPGWGNLETAHRLIARGFSTSGVRDRRRAGDAQPMVISEKGHSYASKVCGRIWKDHEFHCTGVLVLPKGPDGKHREIVVLPPDGKPICSEGDRRRIERARARIASTRPRPQVGLLTGHPASIDGQRARLSLAPDRKTGEIQYQFVVGPNDAGIGARRRVATARHKPVPPLRYEPFVVAMAQAFEDNRLHPILIAHVDTRTRLADAVVSAERELDAASADLERARAMLRKNPSGAAWVETEGMFNAATTAVQDATDEVERRRAMLVQDRQPQGLPLQRIIDLFTRIRDPYDYTYRTLLDQELDEIIVTTTRQFGPDGVLTVTLTVHTRLRVMDDEGREWFLQIGYQQHSGKGSSREARAAAFIEGMRAGVPLQAAVDGRWHRITVREMLGHPADGRCRLAAVRDKRLLIMGMAVNHPVVTLTGPAGQAPLGEAALRLLARKMGEPVSLLRHLRTVHDRTGHFNEPWVRRRSPALADLLARAAQRPEPFIGFRVREANLWPAFVEETPGGYRTRACPKCRSRNRARPLIPEISGMLCLDCRRDDLGHLWPADPYDRYLDLPA